MLNNFEVKPATIDDVPLILSFIKELADYEKLAHEVSATENLLKESLFSEYGHTKVLIGYWQGKPVSFAVYFFNFSTFLGRSGIYLEDLYVKPEVRGQGIGQYMLTFLAHVAKEHHCGRLEWSVLDWNTPAINFYKQLGAKPMDEWTTFRVTEDALDKLAMQWEEKNYK